MFRSLLMLPPPAPPLPSYLLPSSTSRAFSGNTKNKNLLEISLLGARGTPHLEPSRCRTSSYPLRNGTSNRYRINFELRKIRRLIEGKSTCYFSEANTDLEWKDYFTARAKYFNVPPTCGYRDFPKVGTVNFEELTRWVWVWARDASSLSITRHTQGEMTCRKDVETMSMSLKCRFQQ